MMVETHCILTILYVDMMYTNVNDCICGSEFMSLMLTSACDGLTGQSK